MMALLEIQVVCPHCGDFHVIRNGTKGYSDVQNYHCQGCSKQFILDRDKIYQGCKTGISDKIKKLLVRGNGISDISKIEGISVSKVLSVIASLEINLTPQSDYYDILEVDELWSYVGSKDQKRWLLYAYHRETGEIVAWVWGKRDTKTARKLRAKLNKLGLKYHTIVSDNWKSFIKAFEEDNHLVGKQFTSGIEGNNCRIRHRMKRLFRKSCCFSKKEENHYKIFDLVAQYINLGYV